MKLCECGCGQPTPIAKQTCRNEGYEKGEAKRFIRYHQITVPAIQRFLKFVSVHGECHVWTGCTPSGYGTFRIKGKSKVAHRWFYEYVHGPIQAGLQVDHLCRNRRCVRLDHLEAVTPRENTIRSNGLAAHNARKTHCRHGHPYDHNNTHHHLGERICRMCRKLRGRIARMKCKEAVA